MLAYSLAYKGAVMTEKFLTIVFKASTPEELDHARRILRETQEHWAMASWSHAIHDRDELRRAFAMPDGVPPNQVADRVKRLQDAIEGECDGLAVDEQHARAILAYVDGA